MAPMNVNDLLANEEAGPAAPLHTSAHHPAATNSLAAGRPSAYLQDQAAVLPPNEQDGVLASAPIQTSPGPWLATWNSIDHVAAFRLWNMQHPTPARSSAISQELADALLLMTVNDKFPVDPVVGHAAVMIVAGVSPAPDLPATAGICAPPIGPNTFFHPQASHFGGPSVTGGGLVAPGALPAGVAGFGGIAVGNQAQVPGLPVVSTIKKTRKARSIARAVQNNVEVLICPECGDPFTHSGTLYRHIRAVHEKKKPYACARCPDRFSERGLLIRHLQARHKLSKEVAHDEAQDSGP